ncbi:type III pantothenate kinase [Flavobacterium sp.]|uniref:type III pantothenate kinase n=1 Tax=Flavobacterium sp. TaxID=239 RepID=UPI0026073996|nr:type III pantothenate kinase [Flavobacterium sp.]
MLLAIDIGNTRIKGAVFEHDTLKEVLSFSKEALQSDIDDILKKYPKCSDLIAASVGKTAEEAFSAFENRLHIHFISREFAFPFQNLYQSPKTLGIDRMVLASGAVLQYPQRHRLVIDAGTCITYDFVNDQDQYLGGAISPGIRLRYEAMHQYTAKLPLLSATYPNLFIGDTTEQAMHVGVVEGILHEIDGFITQYEQHYPKIIIILTGGDAEFLAKRLKNTIFANSNFLLESLNRTFQYKIKND